MHHFIVLIFAFSFLNTSNAFAGEEAGEGLYMSLFVNHSILKNDGQFTTGAPIPTVETVRYTEKATSNGLGVAVGYGVYDLFVPGLYTAGEISIAYTPFNERPVSPNPNFQLDISRDYVLGAKGMLGLRLQNNDVFYGHMGYYYSNHAYGATYKTAGGWEDHDLGGLGLGIGYRRNISSSLDVFAEYSHLPYNAQQSLKDGASSQQDIKDNDIRIGISYRFGSKTSK